MLNVRPKKQNREVERSYRELVREIDDILSEVRDFFNGDR